MLIAGAGPVGLSLAIELGLRGIRCLAVEQHERVGRNPRAKLTNMRSREILRRWGIAVRSKYLVGADGARSRVRELLGIGMSGRGALAPNLNVIFRAPALAGLHRQGPAVQYWMVNRELPAYLGPMDRDGLWFFIAPRLPGGMDVAAADPKELVQRSCGLNFGLEIVHADPWTAYHLIADRYSETTTPSWAGSSPTRTSSGPARRASAHPGCLAPHFWMADGASLYDQLGWSYTLLADAGAGQEGIAHLERAAAERSVPLKVMTVQDPRFRALYQASCALVRPDQHVAWRGERLPENPAALIDRVRGT